MPPKKFWNSENISQLMRLKNEALTLRSNGDNRNLVSLIHDLWNNSFPENQVSKYAIRSILNRQNQASSNNDNLFFEHLNQSLTQLTVESQNTQNVQDCENHNNLIQYLIENNLVVVDVPGDGHCLLYAVRLCLVRKGFQIDLQEMKNRIIEHIVQYKYHFTAFVANSPNASLSSSQTLINEINSYINQRNYAQNSVDIVVQVLANIYSVRIKIVQTDDEMNFLIHNINPKTGIIIVDIFLKYNANHYQAIVENTIRPSFESVFPLNIPINLTQVDLNQMNNEKSFEQMQVYEPNHTLEFATPNMIISDTTNISEMKIREAKRRIKLGKNHQKRPLYSGVCFNCGLLLFGRVSEGHKRTKAIDNFNFEINQCPVYSMFSVDQIPHEYILEKGKLNCCNLCLVEADLTHISIRPTSLRQYDMPEEIAQLRNRFECGKVALCGLFSSTLTKQNPMFRVWSHRLGETNILHKLGHHYDGMYGTIINNEFDSTNNNLNSQRRITAALNWLHTNNMLYRYFFSAIEAFRRCDLHSCTSVSNISITNRLTLNEVLGKESHGLIIPVNEPQLFNRMKESADVVGIEIPRNVNLVQNIRSQVYVTYNDKFLEAKAFPKLYPYGYGSWYYGCGISISNFIKHRLLAFDSRFRNNCDWIYFMYDRVIKQRLFYFNQSRKINIRDQQRPITQRDIANENAVDEINHEEASKYARYGQMVPPSIPGSKSYWTKKLLDLLAMSNKLGLPTLFITLTQNDNWEELQAVVRGGFSAQGSSFDINRSSFLFRPTSHCTNNSVDTCVAFYQRFKTFKLHFLTKKKPYGPIGKVLDFWWRREYQKRGAIHIHMVVWCDPQTVPSDAVCAEMPRASEMNDPFVQTLRTIVKKYQTHKCIPQRCFRQINGQQIRKCKYGYPFDVQMQDSFDQQNIRYTYKRRELEDLNIVSYNLDALLMWNGHINFTYVTNNGWQKYLAKYISKPEKSHLIARLNPEASDTERYLRTRVIGLLEALDVSLGFNICRASRTIIFLQSNINPKYKFLKRKRHLPTDPSSTDLFYDTKFEIYLDRPIELKDLLYNEYYEQFVIAGVKANDDDDEELQNQQEHGQANNRHDELNCSYVSEYDSSANVPTTKRRKGKIYQDLKGRIVYKRNNDQYCITRWRLLNPYGAESEEYFEQLLLKRCPFDRESIKQIISSNNTDGTYLQECILRNIYNTQEEAINLLRVSANRNVSIEQIENIASVFLQLNVFDQDTFDSVLAELNGLIDTQNLTPQSYVIDLDQNSFNSNIQEIVDTFTTDQRNIFDLISNRLEREQQFLMSIIGQAGTGKSYLLNSIIQLATNRSIPSIRLAPTGSAAYLIGGRTIHNFFQLDYQCKSYLEKGTVQASPVEQVKLIVIDEFSMIEKTVFETIELLCRQHSNGSEHLFFGGKSIILIGDPAQLPAIGVSLFESDNWKYFSVHFLRQVMRQSNGEFVEVLNKVRVGIVDQQVDRLLKSRLVQLDDFNILRNIHNSLDAVLIVSLRKERDEWNKKFLNFIDGRIYKFKAVDVTASNTELNQTEKQNIEKFKKDLYPSMLEIKIDSKVILLKTLDFANGWVNGTLARVVNVFGNCIVIQNLKTNKQLPITPLRQTISFAGSNVIYYRTQYPLMLAWALSVHKVQGMTLSRTYISLNKYFFERGQAYVALSRTKNLEDLFLLDYVKDSIFYSLAHKELLEELEERELLNIDENNNIL